MWRIDAVVNVQTQSGGYEQLQIPPFYLSGNFTDDEAAAAANNIINPGNYITQFGDEYFPYVENLTITRVR
jgi:hypothetical protein